MSEKIMILRGPDRVRKRPAVIFGSDDADGVMNALQMLLDLIAQEGMDGYCSRITLTQYEDNSIQLQDNGRGIFLGSPEDADEPLWQTLFCQLYAGSAYEDVAARSVFEAPGAEAGTMVESMELCAVQYASEYMDVCVVRDGFKQNLHFKKGNLVGTLQSVACTEPSGTDIRLKPDLEVFSEISVPGDKLRDKLQAIAIQIPGMETVFRQETPAGFEETVFCYPQGITDYLQACNKNEKTSAVYAAELTAEGQERYNKPRYTADVNVGICFAKDRGFIKCYHNFKEIPYGGTHRDAVIEKVSQYLQWMLECQVDEYLLNHLQLVIVTNSEITSWQNGTRTAIENTLIRDLAQDAVREDFRYFVKQNHDFLMQLYNH